jgi:pimeloyl-ACP methyl ester carboxylesterase
MAAMRAPDPFELSFARGTMLAWEPPAARADAPALLLLHGAACDTWVWAEGFASRLATAGFAVFAPGFNRARQGRPAGLADFTEDARAAIGALHRRVVLVGHSLGGLVAQRLLEASAVAGVALLAPVPPEGLAWANWRLAIADPPLWRAVARMAEPAGGRPYGTAAEAAILRRALFGPALPDILALHHLSRMGVESRVALLEAQAPQPVPPAWGLGKPAVVFGGRRDPLVPPDAVVRTAAWHAAPFALMDGMAHAMMLDAGWENLADRLTLWLEESYR